MQVIIADDDEMIRTMLEDALTDAGYNVTAVADGGIAADHGFQVGDIILDVGGKTVSTPADVRKSLADARKEGKRAVLFRVKSSQGTKFVALPLGNA